MGKSGRIGKTASQSVVIVDRNGRRALVRSLAKAIEYLVRLGSIPEPDIARMVHEREPLVNGRRLFYVDSEKSAEAGVPELRPDDRSWLRRRRDALAAWGRSRADMLRVLGGRAATRFGFSDPAANAERLAKVNAEYDPRSLWRTLDVYRAQDMGFPVPLQTALRASELHAVSDEAKGDAVEYLRSHERGGGPFDSSALGRLIGGKVGDYDVSLRLKDGRPHFRYRRALKENDFGAKVVYPKMGLFQHAAIGSGPHAQGAGAFADNVLDMATWLAPHLRVAKPAGKLVDAALGGRMASTGAYGLDTALQAGAFGPYGRLIGAVDKWGAGGKVGRFLAKNFLRALPVADVPVAEAIDRDRELDTGWRDMEGVSEFGSL